MAELLRLEQVSLAFGGLQVLQGVSFETRERELLALIGPNGAGKTSVLNCASGIYPATSGRILFGGDDITRERPHRIARRGLARTFQHGELFAHLTVIENLLIARHARIRTRLLAEGLFAPGVRREEAAHRRAVEEILEFTAARSRKSWSSPTSSGIATGASTSCRSGCRKSSASRARSQWSPPCCCWTSPPPA